MELMFKSVVSWYKMSFMVYFEFWLSWFWFGRKFPVKMVKSGHFCIQPDTLTPRRRLLRLGGPELRFFAFSSPPRRNNAPPRRTSLPRHSIALPRRTC